MNYQIITIPILPLGIVNAFLIKYSDGCILVDSGLPNTEQKVEQTLKKYTLKFSDIKYIVITHAHIDHAGNALKLKQLSGAKIIAHVNDLDYYQGNKKMTFCPTSTFAKLFFKTGAVSKKYPTFTPDILLKDDETYTFDQLDIQVIPTHGHTDGSISVIVNKQHAIVGDLVASGILIGGIMFKNRPKRPPFEDNPALVSQQLKALNNCGCHKFYLGHGGPLNKKQIESHCINLDQLN
ncbi:MBL fold metallo-hydrolase [Marinicellulosiphila megalodicopiae]|uniref:MBL fold metallo-hydrolase n=1 Tax=Marinicellulosiphila megalodicopiae TaxID=2724896 RepID=UPI003BAE4D09